MNYDLATTHIYWVYVIYKYPLVDLIVWQVQTLNVVSIVVEWEKQCVDILLITQVDEVHLSVPWVTALTRTIY